MDIDREDAVVDCERRLTAAGRLVTAAVAANTAVMDLAKLLEVTAAADPGFHAGEAVSDAAESLAIARRTLRDFRRITEAHEIDLSDQLEELRAAEDAADRA
jgi:hypothetical protein